MAHELGVAPPCAAQLPYSLIARDWVESPEMTEATATTIQTLMAATFAAARAGEGGKLFGSITSSDIVAAVPISFTSW